MSTETQKPQTEPGDVHVDGEVPVVIEDGPELPQILNLDFVERFEKGIVVYKRWVSACYRLTRETHWVNHGSQDAPKYSLQGPGAEALMNPLGISFEAPHTKQVPLENGGYAYWVEGYMESKTLARRGYYVGYCDSRDQFFNARSGWKPETGHGDVRKSATTNWIVNGVTRLAGLRDPDPELLKAAGLDAGKIAHIDYKRGRTPEADTRGISEPQLKRLWAICKNANVDFQLLKDKVAKFYNLPLVPETDEQLMTAIKRADYENVCKWAEGGGKGNGQRREPGQEG